MNDETEHSRNLADMAFGEALSRFAQAKPEELPAITPLSASDDTIERLIADFENAGQVDDDDNEYWFARDLQTLLGYTKWDNFLGVVSRAKAACSQAGRGCDDHFAGVGKMVELEAVMNLQQAPRPVSS